MEALDFEINDIVVVDDIAVTPSFLEVDDTKGPVGLRVEDAFPDGYGGDTVNDGVETVNVTERVIVDRNVVSVSVELP